MRHPNILIASVFVVTAIFVYQQSRINALTQRLEDFGVSTTGMNEIISSPSFDQIQQGFLRREIQQCRAEMARLRGEVDHEKVGIDSGIQCAEELRDRLMQLSRIASQD